MNEYEWEETGVPARYRNIRLDECPQKDAGTIRKFCLGDGTDVCLVTGGNATAKTKTMCATFTERELAGLVPGLYLSCKYQLCPMFRSSRLTNFGMTEYDLYRKYYEAEYLVIDEYGKGDDGRLERAVVRNILSARYDRGLLTAVITNFTPQEIMGDGDYGLGADVRSRFKETATVLAMDGADWRCCHTGQAHTAPVSRNASAVRCIICGSPMSESGYCTNKGCVANCGMG